MNHITAKYKCPDHGCIERNVKPDANGNPPEAFYCDMHLCGEPCGFSECCCDQRAPLVRAHGL